MNQIRRTATIRLHAGVDTVFPLFTARGEKLWIQDWNPKYIYPESGEPVTGGVFTTKPHAGHDGMETVWITVNCDTERHVASYINVSPGLLAIRIDVACEPDSENTCRARVTYTYTALSKRGNDALEKITDEHYQEYIGGWEKGINHYLVHGEPLQHG